VYWQALDGNLYHADYRDGTWHGARLVNTDFTVFMSSSPTVTAKNGNVAVFWEDTLTGGLSEAYLDGKTNTWAHYDLHDHSGAIRAPGAASFINQ
jgi:hypothetical protein